MCRFLFLKNIFRKIRRHFSFCFSIFFIFRQSSHKIQFLFMNCLYIYNCQMEIHICNNTKNPLSPLMRRQMPFSFCLKTSSERSEDALILIFQKILVVYDLHGKTCADQGTENRFNRPDDDAFLSSASRIFTVRTCEQRFHRRIF